MPSGKHIPYELWGFHPLWTTPVSLFCNQLHDGTVATLPEFGNNYHFLLGIHPINTAHVAGHVTFVKHKDFFTQIIVDDGSGGTCQVQVSSRDFSGEPCTTHAPQIGQIVRIHGTLAWGYPFVGSGDLVRQVRASHVQLLPSLSVLYSVWHETLRAWEEEYTRPWQAWLPQHVWRYAEGGGQGAQGCGEDIRLSFPSHLSSWTAHARTSLLSLPGIADLLPGRPWSWGEEEDVMALVQGDGKGTGTTASTAGSTAPLPPPASLRSSLCTSLILRVLPSCHPYWTVSQGGEGARGRQGAEGEGQVQQEAGEEVQASSDKDSSITSDYSEEEEEEEEEEDMRDDEDVPCERDTQLSQHIGTSLSQGQLVEGIVGGTAADTGGGGVDSMETVPIHDHQPPPAPQPPPPYRLPCVFDAEDAWAALRAADPALWQLYGASQWPEEGSTLPYSLIKAMEDTLLLLVKQGYLFLVPIQVLHTIEALTCPWHKEHAREVEEGVAGRPKVYNMQQFCMVDRERVLLPALQVAVGEAELRWRQAAKSSSSSGGGGGSRKRARKGSGHTDIAVQGHEQEEEEEEDAGYHDSSMPILRRSDIIHELVLCYPELKTVPAAMLAGALDGLEGRGRITWVKAEPGEEEQQDGKDKRYVVLHV